MKSFWKSLVNSTLFIASAGIAQTLVAQEIEQAGIVRISSPRISQSESDQLMPVSATQCNACAIRLQLDGLWVRVEWARVVTISGTGGFRRFEVGRDFDGSYDVYGHAAVAITNSRYSDFRQMATGTVPRPVATGPGRIR